MAFQTIWNQMYTYELKLPEREKLFSFFSSDSVKFVNKRSYLLYNGGS